MSSDNLPFTRDQFLDTFAAYNQAIWPAQIVAYALGITAVAVIAWRLRIANRAVAAILAAFWLWLGVEFLWLHMRTIDTGPGPVVFAIAFVLQGIMWLMAGVVRHDLRFSSDVTPFSIVGGVLIAYAMLVYPVLGIVSGHAYPRQPMFGVAPCPTTIFTFGILLLTLTRVPKYLLAIPFAWAVISGLSAPLNFGIYEDFGLLIAGIVGPGLLFWRDRQPAIGVSRQSAYSQ